MSFGQGKLKARVGILISATGLYIVQFDSFNGLSFLLLVQT